MSFGKTGGGRGGRGKKQDLPAFTAIPYSSTQNLYGNQASSGGLEQSESWFDTPLPSNSHDDEHHHGGYGGGREGVQGTGAASPYLSSEALSKMDFSSRPVQGRDGLSTAAGRLTNGTSRRASTADFSSDVDSDTSFEAIRNFMMGKTSLGGQSRASRESLRAQEVTPTTTLEESDLPGRVDKTPEPAFHSPNYSPQTQDREFSSPASSPASRYSNGPDPSTQAFRGGENYVRGHRATQSLDANPPRNYAAGDDDDDDDFPIRPNAKHGAKNRRSQPNMDAGSGTGRAQGLASPLLAHQKTARQGPGPVSGGATTKSGQRAVSDPVTGSAPLDPLEEAIHLLNAQTRKVYIKTNLRRGPQLAADGRHGHGRQDEMSDASQIVLANLTGTILSTEVDERHARNKSTRPNYSNVADGFVDLVSMAIDSSAIENDQGARVGTFAVNSAGTNRTVYQSETHLQAQQWVNAIRLAQWELTRLHEIYTGSLIQKKGYDKLPSVGSKAPLSKAGKMEGWLRVRFMGQTEWQKLWIVVAHHRIEEQRRRSKFSLSSFGDEVHSPTEGQIYFYDSKKAKKPLQVARHLYSVHAVYPERPEFIEQSTLFKIEGNFPDSDFVNVHSRPRTQGHALLMIDTKTLTSGQNGLEEMFRWIVGCMDAFKLYGRGVPDPSLPEQAPNGRPLGTFDWDPRHRESMFFALPIGPLKDRLFLDRELVDKLDPSSDMLNLVRAQFVNILWSRMHRPVAPNLAPLATQRKGNGALPSIEEVSPNKDDSPKSPIAVVSESLQNGRTDHSQGKERSPDEETNLSRASAAPHRIPPPTLLPSLKPSRMDQPGAVSNDLNDPTQDLAALVSQEQHSTPARPRRLSGGIRRKLPTPPASAHASPNPSSTTVDRIHPRSPNNASHARSPSSSVTSETNYQPLAASTSSMAGQPGQKSDPVVTSALGLDEEPRSAPFDRETAPGALSATESWHDAPPGRWPGEETSDVARIRQSGEHTRPNASHLDESRLASTEADDRIDRDILAALQFADQEAPVERDLSAVTQVPRPAAQEPKAPSTEPAAQSEQVRGRSDTTLQSPLDSSASKVESPARPLYPSTFSQARNTSSRNLSDRDDSEKGRAQVPTRPAPRGSTILPGRNPRQAYDQQSSSDDDDHEDIADDHNHDNASFRSTKAPSGKAHAPKSTDAENGSMQNLDSVKHTSQQNDLDAMRPNAAYSRNSAKRLTSMPPSDLASPPHVGGKQASSPGTSRPTTPSRTTTPNAQGSAGLSMPRPPFAQDAQSRRLSQGSSRTASPSRMASDMSGDEAPDMSRMRSESPRSINERSEARSKSETLLREAGKPLVELPPKVQPPSTGLVGAITAREKDHKRPGGLGATMTQHERERRLVEQRQREMERQNQQAQAMQQQQMQAQYGQRAMYENGSMEPNANPANAFASPQQGPGMIYGYPGQPMPMWPPFGMPGMGMPVDPRLYGAMPMSNAGSVAGGSVIGSPGESEQQSSLHLQQQQMLYMQQQQAAMAAAMQVYQQTIASFGMPPGAVGSQVVNGQAQAPVPSFGGLPQISSGLAPMTMSFAGTQAGSVAGESAQAGQSGRTSTEDRRDVGKSPNSVQR